MAKFPINASSAICWPNFRLMTVMDMDDDKVVKEVADMMAEMKVDKFAELVTLIK